MLKNHKKKQLEIPPLSPKRDQEVSDWAQKIVSFHGRKAPGAIIAAYMVDLALELLPENHGRLNAIAESRVCLADAIQVMTGLTLGNKYLWVKDSGRWALTLYERETGMGFRIAIEPDRIDARRYPVLNGFFRGTRSYDKTPRSVQQQTVNREFLELKRDIFAAWKVQVHLPVKPPLYPLKVCPSCGEYHRPTPEFPLCLCEAEPELYSVIAE